jgi:O-antigen/teichoic acid export membrane protein
VLGVGEVNQTTETANLDASPAFAPRRRGVALNTLWNLAGQSSPLLLAAFAIPILIRDLGVDRFGVLTLAWILVGYFSFFDLGIGRATTKLLAEKIALGDSRGAGSLIWTTIFSMLCLGTCFGGLLFALAPWLSSSALKIPLPLQSETLRSLYWLAIAVPVVTLTCGLRGMLEAQQSFGVVSALRVALGFITYLGPLAVLPFSRSLFSVVMTLVAARFVSCGLHFWFCKRCIPVFFQGFAWDRESFNELLGFGSWLTASNIISPIMVYLDRFLIGSLISISAVAYYTTPSELVTKLWVIPSALAGVLFPAFSETLAVNNQDRATSLYENGVGSTFVILFPFILVTIVLAPEGLRFWLGADFARHSAVILQILAIGVFANSLANMPYALLQASGRPDLTAKLHLVELPCYACLLYLAIRMRGIEGAAAAWTFRLCAEAAILFIFCRSIVKRPLAPRLTVTIVVGTAALLTAYIVQGIHFKILFLVVVLSAFACVTWCWTLTDFQRLRLRSWLKITPVFG